MLALLFAFDPPEQMRLAGEVAVVVILLLFVVAMLVLWRRPAILSRLLPSPAARHAGRTEKLRALEQEVYTKVEARPRRCGSHRLRARLPCPWRARGPCDAQQRSMASSHHS